MFIVRFGRLKVNSAYTHARQCDRYSILHNGLRAWESAKGPSIAKSAATGKKGECVRRRRRYI